MKSEIEIRDLLAKQQERLQEMINEPYEPNQAQLTNQFCVLSFIDALKWVLRNE